MELERARTIAEDLIKALNRPAMRTCERIEIAGSIRRGKLEVKDVELVTMSNASATHVDDAGDARLEIARPKVSESNNGRPATYGKWRTWRKVPEAERMKIVTMTVDDVISTYGVEERTAYNWKTYAGEEGSTTKASKGHEGRKRR